MQNLNISSNSLLMVQSDNFKQLSRLMFEYQSYCLSIDENINNEKEKDYILYLFDKKDSISKEIEILKIEIKNISLELDKRHLL